MSNREQIVPSFLDSKQNNDQPFEPFIGPRPFRVEQADQLRFSGRDTEIDEIVALVTSQRIVLIYAQSGAGKTSIINAGVTPSLEYDGFEVLPVARVQITSPTSPTGSESSNNYNNDIPSQMKNIYIYNALQSLGRERPEINPESIKDLELFEFLDTFFPTSKNEYGEARPQVLIFDQLEELFSFYPDNWIEQQRGFFRQVADSLQNNPLLRVIFVIREDFLAQLDPFRSLLPEKLRTRFRLERLRSNQAILAIKKPLKKLIENLSEDEKANIESEINALVNDLLKMNVEDPTGNTRQLEGEFIEPIQLQVVCRRWWSEREEASKRQVGNKSSLVDLGNVDRALEDFYEDAIHSASKQTRVNEGKIRSWCQQKLVTSSGTRSITHRGQKTTEGLDNDVIDWLDRKYLVRKERRSGASWYELTHDRLIQPIIGSNKKYRIKQRNRRLKIIIPSVCLAIVIPTILILFNAANAPPAPIAYSQNVIAIVNTPIEINLNGSSLDQNDDTLGYHIISSPVNGQLTNVTGDTADPLTYSPSDRVGNDSFAFMISNGNMNSSNIGDVVIAVKAPYSFQNAWTISGANSSLGIAVDSSDNVYVADYDNRRIQKFTSDGTFITEWRYQPGEEYLGGGRSGIAVDSSDNVYVVDEDNGRIQMFTSNGTFIAQWGSSVSLLESGGRGNFTLASTIAVDSSDNVYVVDAYSNLVQKFTSDGTFITEWVESEGEGEEETPFPTGIAVDSSDNVYVAHLHDPTIRKFTSDGTFITEWGRIGSREGEFISPEGIAVDSSDNVYVADNVLNRIQMFTSNGTFIAQWGSDQTGESQLNDPMAVAVDASDNVYVTDSDERVQVFTPTQTSK